MCTILKNATTCSKAYVLLDRIMIEISSEQKRLRSIAKLAHFGEFGVGKFESEQKNCSLRVASL